MVQDLMKARLNLVGVPLVFGACIFSEEGLQGS